MACRRLPSHCGLFSVGGQIYLASLTLFFFFKIFFNLIFWLWWVFIVAHGRSLVAVGDGVLSVVVHRLLAAVASLDRAQAPGHAGFSTCGSQAQLLHSMCDLPDQGSNQCPLHCKAVA